MIEFMIIAAPRSGTAWAANWLTTDRVICLHDPLFDYHFEDLDAIDIPLKSIGIACTGLALFPRWVNKHPCPKVILHRSRDEVAASLAAANLPPCAREVFDGLDRVAGLHRPWTDLYRRPRMIWEHLRDDAFDGARHKQLAQLNVTCDVPTRVQNPEVMKRIRATYHGKYHAALS